MKVIGLEILRCDVGRRNYHFLKLTTDGGQAATSMAADPRAEGRGL
jgi:hypothetical protein